ncbi:MAG: LemA family protein [Parcubacteria group bacterium GW2011_GWA2_47_26]|nr:MAG: LemA family protein [Parcubacteria group bacterium GW2011_GWA2_47_26]
MPTYAWIIIVAAALLILWLIATYNGLIVRRNRAQESWSDIDVQLKRRYDLIPNLVESVKGYMTHERETLEKVTAARTAAMGARTMAEHAKAENMLTETLKSLFAVAENYPDLKASQNFLQLQDELSDTENKIQAARRFYNQNVMDLNTRIQSFPSNIVAGMFSFTAREFFEVEEARMREAVKVKF